jgi:TonB family protein
MNFKPATRRQAAAAAQVLQEAALPPAARPPERRGLSALLPDRPLQMEARPQAAVLPKMDEPAAPKLERRRAAAAVAQKKAVEIEGPLADRKVSAYALPQFPSWARAQGILEADVSIRFTVDESGAVLPGMRVTRTSGYGRIDKLAMQYLRRWRFRPAPGAGVQWGVITFRFVTE